MNFELTTFWVNILLATLDKNEKIVVYEKNYEKKDNVLN